MLVPIPMNTFDAMNPCSSEIYGPMRSGHCSVHAPSMPLPGLEQNDIPETELLELAAARQARDASPHNDDLMVDWGGFIHDESGFGYLLRRRGRLASH